MKLTKIAIKNFGKFSDAEFNLAGKDTVIFYGPNEAGKSTIVSFIKQILFGFYLRSRSSLFFENYRPLRHASPLGGSLFFSDGADSYQVTRLWASGDTKTGILQVLRNGQPIPAAVFLDKFHSINADFYADSFIFNQDTLKQVLTLKQNQLLERIYYLGASQSNFFLDLRDQFAKEASKLFKKTGRKPEVNYLLGLVQKKRDEISVSQNEFAIYRKNKKALLDKEEVLQSQQELLTSLQKQINDFTDLQKKKASFARLQSLRQAAKDISFDKENYGQAIALAGKIDNLKNTIQEYQDKCADYHREALTDIKQLLNLENTYLQKQSELTSLQQEKQLLQEAQNRLIAVSPALAEIARLKQTQLDQLRDKYQIINQETKAVSVLSPKVFTVSALLALLAVISFFFSPSASLSLSLVTVLSLGYAFYLKNKEAKTKKELEKEKTRLKNKYHFTSLAELPFVLGNLAEFKLQENKIQASDTKIEQILTWINSYAFKLSAALQQEIGVNNLTAGLQIGKKRVSEAEGQQRQHELLLAELSENKLRLQQLQAQFTEILSHDKVANMTEYKKCYADYLTQQQITAKIQALTEELSTDKKRLADSHLDIDNEIARLKTKKRDLTKKSAVLQDEIAQIKVKLTELANSDQVFREGQDLEELKAKFTDASREYLADLLASSWIDKFLNLASNRRFPKMIEIAQEYFKILTSGRYQAIRLDKKLTAIRKDGLELEVQYLSRATGEQLYFAVKLAFLETIKDEINLPILIDDSFVNFDSLRVENISKLLAKISKNNQVLIFTAQKDLARRVTGKKINLGESNAEKAM